MENLQKQIMEIVNNSCCGYFYADKDVHDIWHLIYSGNNEMSDVEKSKTFAQAIRNLEMASGSYVNIDNLEKIINEDYSVEAIKKRRDLPENESRRDWYDGILEQLSAKQ